MLPGIALVLNQPPPLSVPDYERTLAIPGSWMSCIKINPPTTINPNLNAMLEEQCIQFKHILSLHGKLLTSALSCGSPTECPLAAGSATRESVKDANNASLLSSWSGRFTINLDTLSLFDLLRQF
jgi:hypothetical protein